jgi:hypothetical protein
MQHVAANLRRLDWTVPVVQTAQALIRVTRNGTGHISTSSAFSILGMPALSYHQLNAKDILHSIGQRLPGQLIMKYSSYRELKWFRSAQLHLQAIQ